MRITLDIEDDILQAAKELADREGSTVGRVISALARRAAWRLRDKSLAPAAPAEAAFRFCRRAGKW